MVFALFGFHCDISCVSNANRGALWNHQAVVGFLSASFEGGNKSGALPQG